MALPDLASATDLSDRDIDDDLAPLMVSVASTLVRQAAASPILSTTSTISLWATDDDYWLDLPGRPVTAVTAVTVDGTAVTDFKLVAGRLWRRCGWGFSRWRKEPVEVVVTMTHGLGSVPADIVQLVCDLTILGITTATAGAIDPRIITESIDDYSVTFSDSAAMVASAMTLPPLTRMSLKARFGGGVALVTQA